MNMKLSMSALQVLQFFVHPIAIVHPIIVGKILANRIFNVFKGEEGGHYIGEGKYFEPYYYVIC
jgi:hypothetical protein